MKVRIAENRGLEFKGIFFWIKWPRSCSLPPYILEMSMTDLMNLAFLVASFGLGIGFVWFCEKLK
jgi:hypothetical protein